MSQPDFVPTFMKKKNDEAPAAAAPEKVAAPAAPTAPEAAAPEAAAAPKKEKKPRQPKAKEMTDEQIAFVRQNVTNMSYGEMAKATGLTPHQVNRILMEFKKYLRSKAGENTPGREKVEEFITKYLSRPEEAQVRGKTSKVKESITSQANDILAQLGINV